MELLVDSDTTFPSYWLNWRVLVCAIWVFGSMLIASLMIWKYEYSGRTESRSDTLQQRAWLLYYDDTWWPCVKEIHPIYLMAFRFIAFLLLLAAVLADVVVHGGDIFYYYTQWTFTLVTIYFGFGLILSINGCYQDYKLCSELKVRHSGIDAEQGLHAPLKSGETAKETSIYKNLDYQGNYFFKTAGICGLAFQVMFQMTAGAVMLTDVMYWSVIFPFLTIKDYELNFLTVLSHSLNAIMLLGDTALNSLRFPWFRISYFMLWTGLYVIFQWIIHVCISIWWPYPFLDLSLPDAPLWYLFVALLHIPCYFVFGLLVEVKYYVLSRWFPQSYQCLR